MRLPTRSEKFGGFIGRASDEYSLGATTPYRDSSFIGTAKGIGIGIATSSALAVYGASSFLWQLGGVVRGDPQATVSTVGAFFKPQTYKEMAESAVKDPYRVGMELFIGGKVIKGGVKQVSKRVYTGTEYKLYEPEITKYQEKARTPDYIKAMAKTSQRLEATQYQYLDFKTQFGGKLIKYKLRDYGKRGAPPKTKHTDVGGRIDIEITPSGQFGGILKTTPYIKQVTSPKRTIQQLSGEVIRVSDSGNIRAFVESRSRYVGKGGKDIYRRKGREGIVEMERIGKFEEYKSFETPFKGTYYEATSQMGKVKYDPASLKKIEIGERISQPPKKIVVETGKPPKRSKRRIMTERGKGYKMEIDLDQFKLESPKTETRTIQEGKSGLSQIYGSKQISQQSKALTSGLLATQMPKLKTPKATRSKIIESKSPAPISDTKYQEYGLLQGGGLSPQLKEQIKLNILTGSQIESKRKSKLKTQLKIQGKLKSKTGFTLRTEPILKTISRTKIKQKSEYKSMQKQRQQLRMRQMQMQKFKPPGIGIGFPKMQPPKTPTPKQPFTILPDLATLKTKKSEYKLGRGKHKRTPRYAPSLTGLVLKIKQPKETKKGRFTGLEIRGI